jgi:hypothetical protein
MVAQIAIHIATKDRSEEEVLTITKNYGGNGFVVSYEYVSTRTNMPKKNTCVMTTTRLVDHLHNVFALAALDGAGAAERCNDIQVFFPLAPSVIVLVEDVHKHRRILDCIEDALHTWPEQTVATAATVATVATVATAATVAPAATVAAPKNKGNSCRGHKVAKTNITKFCDHDACDHSYFSRHQKPGRWYDVGVEYSEDDHFTRPTPGANAASWDY